MFTSFGRKKVKFQKTAREIRERERKTWRERRMEEGREVEKVKEGR